MLPGARRDLPTSIAILHRTRRHLPPHRQLAQLPAPPTQISVSAVPARDAGGLRCEGGWRAAPARGVRREELAGRSVGQPPTGPRRTCRQPTVRKVRRHRNRPAIGGKGVGTVDGRGRLRALGSGLRRRARPPGVGVTSGRCACSRRAATRKRWIPSLLARPPATQPDDPERRPVGSGGRRTARRT